MRVGYLVPQFPGQTHIFFWREIRALEQMGHEVMLFSTRPPPPGLISHGWSREAMDRTIYLGQSEPLRALAAMTRLVPRGLPIWTLREGPVFARDVSLVLAAAEMLFSETKRLGIGHVHVHSCGRAALIAALCRRMGGPSYSLTLHGPLRDYGPGQRFKWRGAAFGTVITQTLEAELTEALGRDRPERLLVQPMGVDIERFARPAPYAPVSHGQPMRLFSCGRLNMVKGHQDVMSAIRQLLDLGVDVRLEIAGEDDEGGTGYRATLEAHLKQLHLRDHVRLLGAVDADVVRQKLFEAHAFVLASWSEPLGVAYMEAMAASVPTIGTDAGGVRELIQDGRTGILVPPRNPGALARVIRDLSGNAEQALRLSAAGHEHVARHHRSELGADLLAREIETTLDSERGRG
ncbi:exopolysaccharide biosynthesis GT4 family glycosyltransferase EpsE [Litorisediminicola beolgyonensis]|uniref:exopolysaccharide biosynthesis GT4 family glycosyltransferase EpsE n=1 Tax=Litorisediminicola beolgyonensis TaxID=1173614 RepID=UPI0036DE60EB